jgi:hypothetical protein
MDTGYETIVDTSNLIWTLGVYLIHGALVFVQASLSFFLVSTGAHNAFMPDFDRGWLRSLGSAGIATPHTRQFGILRIALGLLLLAPLVLGAPVAVSLVAGIAAMLFLGALERRIPADGRSTGRFLRRVSIAFAALASIFMLWEGEDNLVLGGDLLVSSQEWRMKELAWQLEGDPKSPKVGDLAPDFELQDPEGNVRVRLSDFRGKRPVALVFGSYT